MHHIQTCNLRRVVTARLFVDLYDLGSIVQLNDFVVAVRVIPPVHQGLLTPSQSSETQRMVSV